MRAREPSGTIPDEGRTEALGQVSDSPTCQSRGSPWELIMVMLESPPQNPNSSRGGAWVLVSNKFPKDPDLVSGSQN